MKLDARCDRCGKYFPPKNRTKIGNIFINARRIFWGQIEICPDCYASLKHWVFDGKDGKKMTYADKIRTMNNNELRDFICGLCKCYNCRFKRTIGCALKKWLGTELPKEG